jgi:hypothetical protein
MRWGPVEPAVLARDRDLHRLQATPSTAQGNRGAAGLPLLSPSLTQTQRQGRLPKGRALIGKLHRQLCASTEQPVVLRRAGHGPVLWDLGIGGPCQGVAVFLL